MIRRRHAFAALEFIFVCDKFWCASVRQASSAIFTAVDENIVLVSARISVTEVSAHCQVLRDGLCKGVKKVELIVANVETRVGSFKGCK